MTDTDEQVEVHPEGAVGGSTHKDLPKWFEETYPKSAATFIVFYRGLW